MNEHAVEGLDWDPSAVDAEQIGRALLMRLDGLDQRLRRSQDEMLALLDEHIAPPPSWLLPSEPVVVAEPESRASAPVPASLRALVWAPIPSMLPTPVEPSLRPTRPSRRKGLFAVLFAVVAVAAAFVLIDLV